MTSWKTTLGGSLVTVGTALTAAHMFGGMPSWLGACGAALTAAGGVWLSFARDNHVTSEQAGAK